jgi:hypothetical protein
MVPAERQKSQTFLSGDFNSLQGRQRLPDAIPVLRRNEARDQINGRPLLRYSGRIVDCGNASCGGGDGAAVGPLAGVAAIAAMEGAGVVTVPAAIISTGCTARTGQTVRAGPDTSSRPG